MKRYKLHAKISRSCEELHFRNEVMTSTANMEEDPEGYWVSWHDHKKILDETVAMLESQIPERRIAKLEEAILKVADGRCPECGQHTKDWKPLFGSFAPEWFATMKEQGINPGTGHKVRCSLNK